MLYSIIITMDFVTDSSYKEVNILTITTMHVQLSFIDERNLSYRSNLNDRKVTGTLISHHFPKKMTASMFVW